MTSYTTKGNYPYPAATDQVSDYPTTASTFAGYVDNLPNKNVIINSQFDVWQRGTTFTNPATATYTADRWRFDFDGTGGARTISRSVQTAGTSIGGMQARNVAQILITTAPTSGTYQRFAQRVEDVRTFAGETVTLSFWCLSTVASKTITAKAVQNFGTGGSPSAAVTTTIGTATTSTAMVRKSYTFTMPALTSKTIGTAEDSYVEIHFDLGTQTGTFQIWGVQLEQNSTATALERRPLQQELALCQRYYARIVGNAQFAAMGSGLASANNTANIYVKFPQTMRTVSPTASQSGMLLYYNALTTGVASILAQYTTADSMLLQLSTAAVLTTGQALLLVANAAGSYIDVANEL